MQHRAAPLGALPLLLLFVAPLALSLAFIAPLFGNAQGFVDFFSHPQLPGALRLTVFTGVTSTLVSLVLASLITMGARRNLAGEAGMFLAVPHLAFAIALGLLIAPTGLLARMIANLFSGWTEPPPWVTTQDPYGFALLAALVFKETPFLVWSYASLLNRDDMRQLLAGHMAMARSLGHGPRSIWLRVLLPQLLPRIVWPLVAVFAYGMTVVDMALVIGPTQPPTMAQIIWTDLNDGELLANARGGAGVLALSSLILFLLLVVRLLLRLARPLVRSFYVRHPAPENNPITLTPHLWGFWGMVYALAGLSLLQQSISVHWPFPHPLADQFSVRAWMHLFQNTAPVWTSLMLALATSATALAASIAWLETRPQGEDRLALYIAAVALCLPALVIALGQYRLLLQLGLTGTTTGLFLAHLLPVCAYVFIMLQGPYRNYDTRWQAVGAGLGASRIHFLMRVKWPMLKAQLLAATSVGFAVSIAQYVPAQLMAAGRFSTLPMEAVTLSSGGNRPLFATYATALTLLPLIAFLLASFWGRPRWSNG